MNIFEIDKDDYDMLVNQLIFDLIYDYYEEHSQKYTRYDFAKKIFDIVYDPKGFAEAFKITLEQRMRYTMKKRYSSIKPKITINRIGMTDYDALERENPYVISTKTNYSASNKNDQNTIDFEAIRNYINNIGSLKKHSENICKYIQNMEIHSITTDDIIKLLKKFTNNTASDVIVSDKDIKNLLNEISAMNQPSTIKSKFRKRTFASWLKYLFINSTVPPKYKNGAYIITDDKEFERLKFDLTEYRQIVQSIIPPDELAAKDLYVYRTVEYYEAERITEIDTLINIYLSISDAIQNDNPYTDLNPLRSSGQKLVNLPREPITNHRNVFVLIAKFIVFTLNFRNRNS